MSLLRLPYAGLDLESQLTITQFVIPAGAGATFANSNNICTFTSNAAHGLTLNPSAGVPPNYYVTFGGSTSGITGTGVLINNVFRILSIPSTTTFTFYSTITAATVTSTTVIPVFYPTYIAAFGSQFTNGPTQTISSVVTPFPVYWRLGANCNVVVDVLQTALLLDAFTTPSTGTPATAPTWSTQGAASSNGFAFLAPPWGAVFANGTTATSTLSCVN
jgi:hypothetical protein